MLDGIFNNSYPDEGTRCYLNTCGIYYPLSCCHFDSPDSHHGKRNFGITAAIIAAIIAGIARTTRAAVALTLTAIPVEIINAVVSKSAEVLQVQEVLHKYLYQAIHILPQQIDM